MSEKKKCELCERPDVEHHTTALPNTSTLLEIVECSTCGTFEITTRMIDLLERDGSLKKRKYLLSGLSRSAAKEKRAIRIDTETVQPLLDSIGIPKGLFEAIDRLLWHIYQNTDDLAEGTRIDILYDYPITFSRSSGEFDFVIRKAKELGFLEQKVSQSYQIGINGWNRIEELRKTKLNTNQAFVAMWFNPEYNMIWENGFKPALEACGYLPIRIDRLEHIEKTDDKIIAEIRRSSLLVADFTGSRAGVYFEAGFAMGLGVPVVWTCEKKYFDDNPESALHFDTRQFNHILWDNVEDLVERLKNRINAVIKV